MIELIYKLAPLILVIAIIYTIKKAPKFINQSISLANAKFTTKNIIEYEESQVYYALARNIFIPSRGKYKVFTQVSLGEILGCNDDGLFMREINAKRVDFCITNENFHPIAIVEYNGGGHFQGNYKIRDAVKKAACIKAGLAFHIIEKRDLKNIDEYVKNKILPSL